MAENTITRKNLVSSLCIGLLIGIFVGTPLGWLTHRFYVGQRIGQTLVCRERNRNQIEATVQAICGSGI